MESEGRCCAYPGREVYQAGLRRRTAETKKPGRARLFDALVERMGIEPTTSSMRTTRSPS